MPEAGHGVFGPAEQAALRTVVIRGVNPVAKPGLTGIREGLGAGVAWPYVRLVVVVVGLTILTGVTSGRSLQDTFIFSLLVLAVGGVLFVLPPLVGRLGAQPDGRPERPAEPPDLVSLAIASEKLLVARVERSGLEVDGRLRPRLRTDLGLVLQANHGLDLENTGDHSEIEQLIGDLAWRIVRLDRPDFPVWEGLAAMEFTAVLKGCMNALSWEPAVSDESPLGRAKPSERL